MRGALAVLLLGLPAPALGQLGPTPRALDFGIIAPSCPTPRAFVGLSVLEGPPLTVTGAHVEGPEFVRVDTSALPHVIVPKARTTLPVYLAATPEGPWQATLHIETTGGDREVALSGEVRPRVEDLHIRASTERVDLLFVIDDAPSMRDEQLALHHNFLAMAQFMRAQALDANVAVITTRRAHDGVFRKTGGRSVLHAAEPDFESAFLDLVDVGADGPEDHLGLWAVERALSPEHLAGPNAGFVRPDTVFSVILVSDREDRSPKPVPEYITRLQDVRGFWHTHRMTFSAIVGDHGGCSGQGGDAQAGPRYIRVARETGGVFQSVCTTDWSRSLEDLSTLAFGFKLFLRLSHPAIESSLDVFDDLERVPATSASGTVNWTYDYARPSIAFSPFAAPEPDSRVRIDYTPRCQIGRAIY